MGKKALDLPHSVGGLSFRTDGVWRVKWHKMKGSNHFKLVYAAKLCDHSKNAVFDILVKS